MWIDAFDNQLYAGGELNCPSGSPCPGRFTAFMELANVCGDAAGSTQYRWKINKPSTPITSLYQGAHFVHYVTYDVDMPSVYPSTVRDTIYLISGARRESCGNPVYAETLRMANPEASTTAPDGTQWSDALKNVNHPRGIANVTILADGSIGLFGGKDTSAFGCPLFKTPEIMKPEEVFGTGHTGWITGADATMARGYHQVSLLLPDGSVWVGGGEGAAAWPAQPSWNSFEIFKPPYLYQGARPVIVNAGAAHPTAPQAGIWQYPPNPAAGGQLDAPIKVDLPGILPFPYQSQLARAFLIRNGSSTHHLDNHQRYIEVPIVSETPDGNGLIEVQVLIPPTKDVAPKGFYMLFVVLNNGVPSPGRFIQIVV